METGIKRRDFVTKCFKAGVTGCALLYGNSILALDPVTQVKKSDLKSLTYCGFKCTAECTLYRYAKTVPECLTGNAGSE